MKAKKKLRLLLLRWHKRVGVCSVLVLIMLCITGVLLNHTSHLNLGLKPIKSPWVLRLYGINTPEFKGAPLSATWVTQVGPTLYRNEQRLHNCDGQLIGTAELPKSSIWLAACTQQVLLFTQDNELIEVVGEAQGIHQPIKSIGLCDKKICFKVKDGLFLADFDSLEWLPSKHASYTSSPLKILPPKWQQFYSTLLTGEDITWERVTQDIHAARFFGEAGPWILDFFVALFMFISLSGFYLWYRGIKRTKRT